MRPFGLAVVLALGLVLAPLAAGSQPTEKVYRIGWLAIVLFKDSMATPWRRS